VTFADYDKAIIISGDGDFACLHEFLEEKAKLLHIMTPNAKYSQLLKPFASRIIRVDTLKSKLSLNVSKHQKSQHRRSVETLGVSGNGDASSVAKKTAKVKNQPSSRRGKKVQ
jgi:hypothetical protein